MKGKHEMVKQPLSEHKHCHEHEEHNHDNECHDCGCGHDHCCAACEGEKKVDKLTLLRLAVAACLFAVGLIFDFSKLLELVIFIAVFLISGYDVIINGIKGVVKGHVLDENLLMSVAGIGAFAIGEYSEGAIVMVLYQIGEILQSLAVASSRNSVSKLMDLRPETVNVIEDGVLKEILAEDAQIGMTIVIKPGERVALDCVIIEGESSVDTSALTGESLPRTVAVSDTVLAGSVNTGAILYGRVEHVLADSAVSRILELVEQAENTKAKPEKLMSRFARIYTPVVIAAAFIIAFAVPLISGQSLSSWVHRGLIFLVISCPCAIVISIPLTYFSGIGGAARTGVLFKSASALDTMSNVGAVVFDKTGTLTTGKFKVESIYANGIKEESLLNLAAHIEAFSEHPLAVAIKETYNKKLDISRIEKAEVLSGKGVSAVISGVQTWAGNGRLMKELNIDISEYENNDTTVFIAIENQFAGYITFTDTLKSGVAEAMNMLRHCGIKHLAMITGDKCDVAEKLSLSLGITDVYADCMPEDKIRHLDEVISETAHIGKYTLFVGDGINDAPALKAADIGVAMGGLGADAAIESADVVIMDDKVGHLIDAITAAKNTKKIIIENIVLSLAIKFVVMVLGVFGIATMWLAIFADVGTAIIAILNAVRALSVKQRLSI